MTERANITIPAAATQVGDQVSCGNDSYQIQELDADSIGQVRHRSGDGTATRCFRPEERLRIQVDMPQGFYRWNRALRGAFCKGFVAWRTGTPKTACPYVDKRNVHGRLTFSRSFEYAWRDGYAWARKQAPQASGS